MPQAMTLPALPNIGNYKKISRVVAGVGMQ